MIRPVIALAFLALPLCGCAAAIPVAIAVAPLVEPVIAGAVEGVVAGIGDRQPPPAQMPAPAK